MALLAWALIIVGISYAIWGLEQISGGKALRVASPLKLATGAIVCAIGFYLVKFAV